jgi:hypothetical protein
MEFIWVVTAALASRPGEAAVRAGRLVGVAVVPGSGRAKGEGIVSGGELVGVAG